MSLLGLDRLSVLQRVSGGMGIILLLLVMLSVISWQAIRVVETQANSVSSSVSETSAVAELAARVERTHFLVTQYALSESDDDLRQAKDSLNQVQEETRLVAEAYPTAGDNQDVTVAQLRVLADRYRELGNGDDQRHQRSTRQCSRAPAQRGRAAHNDIGNRRSSGPRSRQSGCAG